MSRLSKPLLKSAGANKKKLFVLILLLPVLAVAVTRMISKRPAQAAAAQIVTTSKKESKGTIQQPGQTKPRRTAVIFVDWPPKLSRDPFGFDSSTYERRTVATRQERTDVTVRKLASDKLRLQAIMRSGEPRALVNNQLLKLGERVEGFVVKDIGHRYIVVEKEGIEVKMEM